MTPSHKRKCIYCDGEYSKKAGEAEVEWTGRTYQLLWWAYCEPCNEWVEYNEGECDEYGRTVQAVRASITGE